MKILVMCGNGLGSSFMMELNVKKAIKELGITAEVDHTDLTTGKSMDADIYLGAKDIMSNFKKEGAKVVGLENIMDLNEIKNKISVYL
ncbi:PTS sugar transporter subunit IIB [uncultured Ilyobacter sp.]|uniref:PTS sugar transporter subunit IIB n=1 Tax=uncultured Ilyobacter sp. TaxID=544433 RepID=UPI0029C79060|nr:PTS sugar transporter subunit IIB [uncultured Ilyobacter sp.]